VNEEGSKAAAATAIVCVAVSCPVNAPPPEKYYFHADHPLMFFIVSSANDPPGTPGGGKVLFTGVYSG